MGAAVYTTLLFALGAILWMAGSIGLAIRDIAKLRAGERCVVIILNVGGLFLLVVVVVAVVGLWRWLRKPVDDPHMAKSRRTGILLSALEMAVAMVMPAEGPSFGVAPSGRCTWKSMLE